MTQSMRVTGKVEAIVTRLTWMSLSGGTNMSEQLREWTHTLLLVVTFLFLVSGMGITEPNLINAITLRLLSKETSYRIHTLLLYPFTALLLTHLYLVLAPKIWKKED